MLDLISIGDSTVDVFLDIEEASVNCSLDPSECKLILDYADKIPVKTVQRVAGVGNAANNAVGSARLGIKTALYTMVGDDRDGEEMREIYTKEGVVGDYVMTDKGKRSNFSVVLNYKKERTILVFHEDREYDLPKFQETKWVYFTSVGKGHERLHAQVPEYVKTSGVKLVFQPGSHQIREGREAFKAVIELAEVLIVNKREAEEILDGAKAKERRAGELLRGLKDLGPKLVVITDGDKGSYSYDGERMRCAGVFPETKMVERTGAGDAYATGLVTALILGKDVDEAMRWGSANASSVIEHVGAREGLLSLEGMQARLKGCPECQVLACPNL